MEEAPRRGVRLITARELAVEIVIIVLAVLIALSVEGVRGWRADRAKVAEARANISKEMRDNKAEIDSMPAGYARVRAELDAAAAAAQTILDTKKGPSELNLHFEFAELGRVSRTTAELTGALALMDYDEVRKYEAIYETQEMFSSTERRCYQDFLSVISYARLAPEPEKALPAELIEWRRQIYLVRSTIDVLEQIAKRLSAAYGEALHAQ